MAIRRSLVNVNGSLQELPATDWLVGIGAEQPVVLGADVSQSTTTLADVTGLGLTLAANTLYRFEYLIRFTTAATTTGLALSINGPASPTFVVYAVTVPISATGDTLQYRRAYNAVTAATAVDAANSDCLALVIGLIRTTSAGGLVPRYATEVAASAVTIKQYSCGMLTQVG